ncbi:hypothetical protein [Streptomyces sp. NPDC093707]|uniref:hypothetical protein n=1 Tax=Streptomyces sp. NPDC093707 TaxID=3154984 RepID=UPI00344C39ED
MPPRARKNTDQADDTAAHDTDTTAAADSAALAEPGLPPAAKADAENKAAADADVETKIPDVTPLEPPTPPVSPAPERAPLTTAQQVLPADLNGTIVDETTGLMPDPEGVFVLVEPFKDRYRCTVRLVEHVGMGVYQTPTAVLRAPVGAEFTAAQAHRIITKLREQVTAAAAAE